MKTLKFYIGNHKANEIIVTLSSKELKIFDRDYGFKTPKQLYDHLYKKMKNEFRDLYASFEDGKHDYENFIHEIVDTGVYAHRFGQMPKNSEHMEFQEDINDFLEAGPIMMKSSCLMDSVY